jgi:hypothetical protein
VNFWVAYVIIYAVAPEIIGISSSSEKRSHGRGGTSARLSPRKLKSIFVSPWASGRRA